MNLIIVRKSGGVLGTGTLFANLSPCGIQKKFFHGADKSSSSSFGLHNSPKLFLASSAIVERVPLSIGLNFLDYSLID